MNIGIRLHDTAPGSLRQRLGFARKQGFSCVHLALSKTIPGFSMDDAPALLNGALANELKEDFMAQGLDCAVLGCYLKIADTDEEALRHTLDIYRAHLRFARMIGAGVVGTETPLASGVRLDAGSPEALALFLRCVEPLVRCAEEEGAILAIEPVACHIVNTPRRMEQLLEAVSWKRPSGASATG